MSNLLRLCIISSLFTASATTWAATPSNVIGLNLGYGGLNASTKLKDFDSSDLFDGDLYYRRMFNENFGLEVGYRSSTGGLGSMLISPLTKITDISYYGPHTDLYANYPLTGGFSLYGKAGINYYKLDYTYQTNIEGKKQQHRITDSELGGEIAAGVEWRYEWLGFNLGYMYSKSDLIETSGVQFGTSIHF
ncbi:TPA: outer membrane beta-barrel protein [Photobacterium damselae]